MSHDGSDPLLVKPDEAARLLAIGRSKLYLMMARGDIRSVDVGGVRRVPVEEIRRIADGRGRDDAP